MSFNDYLHKYFPEFPLFQLFSISSSFFILFIVTSLIWAFFLCAIREDKSQSIVEFLLPKSIYKSKCFYLDFSFYLLNGAIYFFVVLFWTQIIYSSAVFILDKIHIKSLFNVELEFTFFFKVFYTLVLILTRDFAVYWIHRWHHTIPFLWEFHKIHHSTTKLNPFSAHRFHPVDEILHIAGSNVLLLLVTVLFLAIFQEQLDYIDVLGANIFFVCFRLFGYHLRHSHIWFSWGNFLGHIFISPSHHQIHHSNNPKHFDKNMGQMFALWDWAFGTLYVPAQKNENIAYGISTEEEKTYISIKNLYLVPFVKSVDCVKKSLLKNKSRGVL